jgi:murein tripeptide amidase MpaA
MINVDGVRHGNFRFSSSGVDLNRRWKNPTEEHHP